MPTFARELAQLPISVPRAGLLFAREIAYPELDVPHYMDVLDDLAEEARAQVTAADNPADALADFLFHKKRFRGNEEAYSDPRNSYLNEVLERGLGIPISLSIIYVAVARRLSIDAYGLSLPGHFIVGVRQGLAEQLMDPFHEGQHLTLEDCERLVRQTTGLEGVLDPAWLRPATPRAILARMLNNLRVVYVQRERWSEAVSVIERLRQVQPDASEHLRDLGLLHYQQGHFYPAAQYLEAYLEEEPDSPEASAIRQNLQPVFSRWAQMN